MSQKTSTTTKKSRSSKAQKTVTRPKATTTPKARTRSSYPTLKSLAGSVEVLDQKLDSSESRVRSWFHQFEANLEGRQDSLKEKAADALTVTKILVGTSIVLSALAMLVAIVF